MSVLQSLETKLDEMLVKKAPYQLPENAKKMIVEYLPWINLVLGLLTLWAAWVLWHWTRVANDIINYTNSLSQSLGGKQVPIHHLTIVIWLGIFTLAVEGLLFVAAFPRTRDRKKSGWNLLFYAALVNILYGIVILFSDYGSVERLIMTLITTGIGLYFLFQIRSFYTGRRAAVSISKDTV